MNIDYREDAKWTVYVHTCIAEGTEDYGKTYVGITSRTPEQRWQNGLGYKSQFFYTVIARYGWSCFEHQIVAEHLTVEEAANMERALIRELKSLRHEHGYNVSPGGLASLAGLNNLKGVTLINLVGRRFGMLEVIDFDGYRLVGKKNPKEKGYWLCKCDCGNTKSICGDNLRARVTNSCGCQVTRATIERSTKHGYARRGKNRTPLYGMWAKMNESCYSKNNTSYSKYGGSGITVCEEWKTFEQFLEWALQNGYKEGLSLDRIDDSKNFIPDNCRFVDHATHMKNCQPCLKITFGNVTHTLKDWCNILKLNYTTVNSRRRRGIDLYEAMFTPVFK